MQESGATLWCSGCSIAGLAKNNEEKTLFSGLLENIFYSSLFLQYYLKIIQGRRSKFRYTLRHRMKFNHVRKDTSSPTSYFKEELPITNMILV